MANYLNKPISSGFRNTYTSQFVPLPLEQFARTNELNQAKQDQQVTQLAETDDALWKVKGIAGEDNEYVGQLKGAFEQASSELVNKDLTQRENQDSVKGLIKGVSRDPALNTIMANTAKYQEYLKNKEDSIKAGNYSEENDLGMSSINDYVRSGGYKSGKGIDSTIFKYEAVRPVQEQFVNDMNANGADVLKKAGETFYTDGFKGITKNQAYGRVMESFTQYSGTQAAQQEGRRYDLMVSRGQLNPKKQSKEDFLFKGLLDAGLERVYNVSNTGIAAALNADKKEKEAKKEAENLFAGMESTEAPSTLNNGRTLEFANGKIKGSGKSIVDAYKTHGFSLNTLSDWWNSTDLNDKETEDAKHVIVGAKLNGVSEEEYNKAFDKTWHPIVPKPLIGKALEDNNNVFRKAGSGVWSNIMLNNVRTGEKEMNFIDAINKLADEKGFDVPNPDKEPKEYNELLDNLGVRVTGAYAPNRSSARSIEIKIGGNTFAGDLTNSGTYMKGVSQQAIDAANLDKLNAGEQVLEKDSKGNDVIYFKSMTKKDPKTGEYIVDYKVLPKKK